MDITSLDADAELYPAPPMAEQVTAEISIGDLCAALAVERQANAALLAVCFRLAAELNRRPS